MINRRIKNNIRAAIKIVYRDWFDRKSKYHICYTNEDAKRFIEHNKIEVIGMS